MRSIGNNNAQSLLAKSSPARPGRSFQFAGAIIHFYDRDGSSLFVDEERDISPEDGAAE